MKEGINTLRRIIVNLVAGFDVGRHLERREKQYRELLESSSSIARDLRNVERLYVRERSSAKVWKHKAEEMQSLLKIQLHNYHELEAELETLKAQQIGWAEQCECVGGGQ